MLAILNKYINGYVAIPVILACREHNLFRILNSTKAVAFTELVKELQANSGHIRIALQMLESLDWVSRTEQDKYLLTSKSDLHLAIPEDVMELMTIPKNGYLNENPDSYSLKRWIEMSSRRWVTEDMMLASFLDGMLVIPLLLALKENNLLNSTANGDNQEIIKFSKLTSAVREEIIGLFCSQGWLLQEEEVNIFTETGRFMVERILMDDAVASYRPILMNIGEVIFGDCKTVFQQEMLNHKLSVDHPLNIIGNPSQQEETFIDADMEECIISIFNRKPYTEQPKYIADINCRDGKFLKKIFEIIRNKSLRGKVLNEYPVKLIGIGFNEQALAEMEQTLKDINHIVLQGDIGNPEQIIVDLKNIGINDPENILHVRSFMDHNRPYIPPMNLSAVNPLFKDEIGNAYVDVEGKEISLVSVTRSLVEHFERWAKVIEKYGLFVLEAHCLEPKTANEYLDLSEGRQFDVCHQFSQQLLVEAARFLMAAAEAGLFPKHDSLRKYPKTSFFNRITLTHIERRDYRIRFAQEKDLPALEELERKCWEPGLQTSASILKQRLHRYPKGQLVLEKDNQILGVIYSQRIANTEDLKSASVKSVESLHRNDGTVIQLLTVNILPEMQHLKLGDQLLEFMLQLGSLMNGIRSIIAVTRCKNYYKHNNISQQEYIHYKNKRGSVSDPILRFHELHGAQITELIPNYRPEDVKNQGHGVLVEYDIFYRQRKDIQVTNKHFEKAITETIDKKEPVKDFIAKTITTILGKTNKQDFSIERPLMDMGLDSSDLIELNDLINHEYQIMLDSSFFFRYKTAGQIINYLQEKLNTGMAENVDKIQETILSTKIQEEHSEISQLKAIKQNSTVRRTDVAIIGVACRLPGNIRNKEQLWELLVNGKDAIVEIPQERLSWPENIHPKGEHQGIDWGGLLDGIAEFDPSFFRISPKEAELMDPQQRILLELSWECLEDAGYKAKTIAGSKTGVFVGASGSDYKRLLDQRLEEIDAHYGIGTSLAILPNRLSYFYDFNGPSMQIDTACSSSLVAVHEAAKSLLDGECEQALVGGINIICHPSNSIAYYKAGMLANDGRCKTFDKEANGYVRGEGAVMLLLKPLEKAFDDKDPIYAVIKGTAINHGGQASGITVPNPDKQAALLVEAYQTAKVEPETVGYVEAHGTGTFLGDPIEISGLKEAFGKLSKGNREVAEPYCGIGSIKTNIGHLEAAAGLVGLLKVVLSMKNRTLPASLHFKELNPQIDLRRTPFYVVNKNLPWRLPHGQLLRRAGVSSFGSGGANAHAVLEEAPIITRQSHQKFPGFLICLSAKTEIALRQREQDLAHWLEKEGKDKDLTSISATLLIGREHFGIRSAYVISDIQELQAKVRAVIEKGQAEGYYREDSLIKRKQLQPIFEDFGQKILKELAEIPNREYNKKLKALAELYVKGYDLDWEALYGNSRIPHISMPAYPFAKESYWIPKNDIPFNSNPIKNTFTIHPLLHQNTSDFYEWKFTSTFTRKDIFIKDNTQNGQQILSWAVQLEMIQAAIVQDSGAMENDLMIRLTDLYWDRPIMIGAKPVQVHIGLSLEENEKLSYRIYSDPVEVNADPIIYSQGSAILNTVVKFPILNLKELQYQCSLGQLKSIQNEYYNVLMIMGIDYGKKLANENFYVGEGLLLAKLSLPFTVSDTTDQVVLDTSLMNLALQIAVGFIMDAKYFNMTLPVALQEFKVYRKCVPTMWVVIHDRGNYKVGEKELKLDIDLCDEEGNVYISFKGLFARIMEEKPEPVSVIPPKNIGTLLLEPIWEEQAITQKILVHAYNQHLVVFCEPHALSLKDIETKLDGARYLILETPEKSIEERFQSYAAQLFAEIQNILKADPTAKVLIQIVVPIQGEKLLFSSLNGMLKTAKLEATDLIGQLIEVDPEEDINGLIDKLKENSCNPNDSNVRYQDGKRWIKIWNELQVCHDSIPWKDHGIYLITGGVGVLGLIFAKEIATKVMEPTLILTGRSPLNMERQIKIDELEKLGARIVYKQVDVAQKKEVAVLIENIREEFGSLHGIIHAAGVIQDSYIIKKTKDELKKVLTPKVDGLVNLDQASKDLPLDFFICFSSIAILGNLGQADYATANAFMDAYAEYRNTLVDLKQRQGKTLSINWPHWKDGGIGHDEENLKLLKLITQNTGMIPMSTQSGLRAFYLGLTYGKSQVIVAEGDIALMQSKFVGESRRVQYSPVGSINASYIGKGRRPEMKGFSLEQCVEWELKEHISNLLKIPRVKIDKEDTFVEFGFNSISLRSFATILTNHYGFEITPTLFFGYFSIEKLIQYFLTKRQEEMQDFYRENVDGETASLVTPSQMPEPQRPKINKPRLKLGSFYQSIPEPIAIIGMSGRFPGARNIEELWTIIAEGQDMVKEIPAERFDWRQYYGDPNKEPGKTNCKWCGCISGVSEFDPLFFEISPREAEIMDPRQRLLLEEAWKALEDAGYGATQLKSNKIGMFVGVEDGDYQSLVKEKNTVTANHDGILAARLAYFLNLQGPVMAINTACSSGLVAAHQACLSLRNQECDTAIAAGVHLMLTPMTFIVMSQSEMLSDSGKCHTFDKRADGMVPGEAVAVVVLKRLSKAEEDGDPIYAVIQGSGVNYDGKTNGITAPNGVSQTNLLKSVYDKFQVNPEEIEYIVTHGTGTKLGDPIEINALYDAFKDYTKKLGYCALTSTKTNFGHTMAPSGLVSLISLVQAMRHETIPASLHCEQENDYINWQDSPFYVSKKNRPWMGNDGKNLIGALSAFGHSGTNAHMVVRSYNIVKNVFGEETPYYLLVFSAKTQEALAEKLKDMIGILENKNWQKTDLFKISYTLLEGRHHFNHRYAIVIQDLEDAIYILKQMVSREKLPNSFQGQVSRGFTGQKAIEQYGKDLLKQSWSLKGDKNKYQETLFALADLYCQGYDLPWEQLFENAKPRRINLPTYPFAKETYWISEVDTINNSAISLTSTAFIHPLLHQNTSNLSEQRFSSLFTGEEFFLRDHVVKGQKFLPGVAYLEMARAAVEAAAGVSEDDKTGIKLKNVVWARPIIVREKPVQVHIGLFPDENGAISYEIYSEPEEAGTEVIVHSQGSIELISYTENLIMDIMDIKEIQSQCNLNTLSSSQCYEFYKVTGIEYGPGHQGIENVYIGHDCVLAKLSLPASISETRDQYVLHPSLMDSALQATMGLMVSMTNLWDNVTKSTTPPKPALPFALNRLEIYHRCTVGMWAYIRYSEGSKAGGNLQKLDIDLCDDQGNVCVRIREFVTRVLEGEAQINTNPEIAIGETSSIKVEIENQILTPLWDTVLIKPCSIWPTPAEQIAVIGGTEENREIIRKYYPEAHHLKIEPRDGIEEIIKKLEATGPIDHLMWIAPAHSLKSLADNTLIKEQNRGALQVFRLIKALLRLGYETRKLGWTIITIQTQSVNKNDTVDPTHASIYGLIGSMAKEYQNWKVRLIDLEADCEWPIEDILSLPADPQGDLIVYRDREWYRQGLVPMNSPKFEQKLYRPGGVYVVIGGAGGIGEAWSEYMLKTYQAQIIWIGRRPKDAAIQAKIDRLATMGLVPEYIAADATDQKALEQAYKEIKQRHSQIHGVVHSAIVLLDQSLAKMEEERFKAALSVKVDLSVHIAQVFQKESLDFVLFFSSAQSFTKSPGQSNYAAGCTFKDAFANQLSREWTCAIKIMNWGYWGNIGVVSSKAYQERMAQFGLGSIEPPEAMEALEVLLNGPVDQIVFLKTTKPITLDGIKPEEFIAVYPESLIGNNQELQIDIPEQAAQIGLMKSEERSRQIKEMNDLLCKLLWGHLQAIGLFKEKQSILADLKTKTGLRDLYNRWLDESIAILKRNNYLEEDGKSISVIDTTAVDMDAAWEEWDQQKGQWLEDPNMKAQVILVEATLRALPEILTGKVLATDIMFPNSSMTLVEGIYKYNIVSDYFNEVQANTVVGFIKEQLKKDPSVKIKIIEVGAGTGGTSFTVIRKLVPYEKHIQEYCYTDISKAFLMHAEKEYGPKAPYLTYQLFNVEMPIAGQEISAGEYDIVIATNVLHATQNIRRTLRNVKAVLKKNGLLILNEMSSNPIYIHLTYGLLKGWWLYEDSALRIPGCPALYPEGWQKVLEGEGFKSVFFPAQEDHELGQQIVIAESNGVIRQKQEIKPRVALVKQNVKTTVRPTLATQKPPLNQVGEITLDLLREKSTAYIKKLVGETLKMSSNKIDSTELLEKYGIDSILVIQLTNTLRGVFDNISSTLFFEYQTIDALVEYFLKTQKDSLRKLVGLAEQEFVEEISNDEKNISLPIPTSSNLSFRRTGRFLPIRVSHPNEEASRASTIQDIAIIGLSGRYPEANGIHEFWNNLKDGKNCITEIPKERFDWKKFYDEEKGKAGSIYTKWGGFIKDMDKFDPLFFQISPREAEQMDPQERVFLETAYASIEDAGYTPGTLCGSRKVGVFVGVMNGNYMSGASYWSIANRISYFMNFQGPSMAVDTACSSSLTALHLALESLYCGISECAIAGGVNLIVDPIQYIKLTAATMLTAGDKCISFGDHADGFVDGEAVGAIVLKPLSKAVADGDHIYGILKGSMINAGGKTNGFTVPNPNAQHQLVYEALQRANIPARTISYVEAHGTGTALGDPIEIAGLTRAFEHETTEKQFCAIGSAKSNIGHCESAAGIAGVTKVLLQLKNGQIAPSLHSEVLNPNIDFKNTPFIVQQTLGEWKRPVIEINGEGKEYPRIAGISSFGAGGSNAHVVIEEYIPQNQERVSITITPQNPAIIVLSAKDEERLKEQVQQLLVAINKQLLTTNDLADTAYTLQVGREAMEERLAMTVSSIEELVDKLQKFIEGKDNIEYFYRGQVKRNKENLTAFTADEELYEAISKWIERKKYSKLLDFWVRGFIFDWNKLYGDIKPRRISLPTYPFARDRYWLPENDKNNVESKMITTIIHPLLHQNTSNLLEQQFTSTFTGEEFFLKDHVVKGQRILPGVAYLEMARAAVETAAVTIEEDKPGIRFKNVVWIRPITIGKEPIQVQIRLFLEENGEIVYEIYSKSEEAGIEAMVHSQGNADLISYMDNQIMDVKEILSQCNQSSLSPSQCYDFYKTTGIEYGPGYQGIERVYIGRDRVLAKLSLPISVSETINQYFLHPSLMDSALQALICLIFRINSFDSLAEDKVPLKLALPVALNELEIYHKCTPKMWAYVRYSEGSKAGDKLQKVDIDISDEQGNVCVRMKEFVSTLEEEIQTINKPEITSHETSNELEIGNHMLTPVWDKVLIKPSQIWPLPTEKIVVVGGTDEDREVIRKYYPEACYLTIESGDGIEEIVKKLETVGLIAHLMWIASAHILKSIADNTIIEKQNLGVIQVFRLIKALLRLGYETENLGLTAITKQTQSINKNDATDPTHSTIYGLIGSIAKEYLNWKFRVLDLEAGCEWPITDILALPPDSQGNLLVYRDRVWYRQGLVSVQYPKLNQKLYRLGGVYVVIGGSGGIGEAWSEYMIKKYQAQIIWIGRRQRDETIQAKLDRLAVMGPVPEYIAADATDQKALEEAYQKVKQKHTQIHGVVHSAILLLDQSFEKMEEERFKAALSVKVDLSVHIAQVFQKESLDFVLFFSSAQSFTKSPGQSNYAAGCTFKDAFANQLSREWTCMIKIMNWGYWGNIGVVSSKAYQERMTQFGLGSIEPPEAMEALEVLLNGPVDQIAFLKTTKPITLDGIKPEEYIAVNQESPIHIGIKGLKIDIPEQVTQIERIKLKRSQLMADRGDE